MKNIDPVSTKAWNELNTLYSATKKTHLRKWFESDPERFETFSRIQGEDLLLDFSKNRIDEKIFDTLLQLAEDTDVKGAIEAMFKGEKINRTENRAVLHTALRNRSDTSVYVDGKDVMPEIHTVLNRMEQFCNC